MKKLLFIIMLIPILTFAQSQVSNYGGGGATGVFGEFASHARFTITKNNAITGSKYLVNEWSEGYLVIKDSVFSYQEKMLFDQIDNNIILSNDIENEGVIVYDNDVTGFIISKDGIKEEGRYFTKINYSLFDGEYQKTKFYEVVNNFEKTNYLIKDTEKYLYDPNRSSNLVTNNNFGKEYKERITYYIKNNTRKYISTKLNKKHVLNALDDKRSEIITYSKRNKIDFNKEFDIAKVLNYYHSL
jgi:hypothetical protein